MKPSQSRAARAARGRVTLSISVSAESAERLRDLAARHGLTLGELVIAMAPAFAFEHRADCPCRCHGS